MKFGQQLLESMPPDWKFYFVDYQGLKQYIKLNTQVKGPWNNNNEDQFMTMLEDEVKKVSWFMCNCPALLVSIR
jgi:SPX domain protein involved in polyphosphate accumulation